MGPVQLIDHPSMHSLLSVDVGRVEIVDGREAATEVDAEHVRQMMRERGWRVGPVEDPDEFSSWLTAQEGQGADPSNAGDRIFVLAAYRFSLLHPDADQVRVEAAANQLSSLCTGSASPEVVEGSRAAWVEQIVLHTLAGMDPGRKPGTYTVPIAIEGVAAERLAAMVLALVEALHFLPSAGAADS